MHRFFPLLFGAWCFVLLSEQAARLGRLDAAVAEREAAFARDHDALGAAQAAWERQVVAAPPAAASPATTLIDCEGDLLPGARPQGNVEFAPGVVGQAASFDGDSWLEADVALSPERDRVFSVAAWFLPIADPGPALYRRGLYTFWKRQAPPPSESDRFCIIHSLNTEAINHDPAVTYLQTGHQQPGRPSLGAWLSYGLGSETGDLPTFVVLLSRGSAARPDDPLYARLWGSGFLPANHQGVAFRSVGDPVLYLTNPPGVDRATRRDQLDAVRALNERRAALAGDPDIATRVAQYEMAFRMQADGVHVHDLNATILHCLGIDQRRLTYRFQGREFRLTDVHGRVIREILS